MPEPDLKAQLDDVTFSHRSTPTGRWLFATDAERILSNLAAERDDLSERLKEAKKQLERPLIPSPAQPRWDAEEAPGWEDNFYKCQNTGEWVYKWADDRVIAALRPSAAVSGGVPES